MDPGTCTSLCSSMPSSSTCLWEDQTLPCFLSVRFRHVRLLHRLYLKGTHVIWIQRLPGSVSVFPCTVSLPMWRNKLKQRLMFLKVSGFYEVKDPIFICCTQPESCFIIDFAQTLRYVNRESSCSSRSVDQIRFRSFPQPLQIFYRESISLSCCSSAGDTMYKGELHPQC